MLLASHKGGGPIMDGTHLSMREREHGPELCNNGPYISMKNLVQESKTNTNSQISRGG